MSEDLQLHGLSAGTQELYVRVVRQLAEYWHKSPDRISEEELRQYFLYLTNEKRVARSTFTIVLCGIKFFYENTLQRDWATLALVRPAREMKLPVVLSRAEVGQILGQLRTLRYQVCLGTIYSCGLRIRGSTASGGHDTARACASVTAKAARIVVPAPIHLDAATSVLAHAPHPLWLFPMETP
jgi:site-specific recombinase XerD